MEEEEEKKYGWSGGVEEEADLRQAEKDYYRSATLLDSRYNL